VLRIVSDEPEAFAQAERFIAYGSDEFNERSWDEICGRQTSP
jgi:hypothetical protein